MDLPRDILAAELGAPIQNSIFLPTPETFLENVTIRECIIYDIEEDVDRESRISENEGNEKEVSGSEDSMSEDSEIPIEINLYVSSFRKNVIHVFCDIHNYLQLCFVLY